ncbi:MAG: FtsX-like permease family protein [Planctomycetota bacterium]
MDRLFDYLLSGLRGVLRHPLRSVLTVTGIVLAITALLSMMAVGEGARQQILKEMEQMGLRNIIVTSRRPPKKVAETSQSQQDWGPVAFGLTNKDLARCRAILPGLGLVHAPAVHELRNPVVMFGRKVNARVLGITEDYFKTFKVLLNRGRLLCAADGRLQTQACLLATPIPSEILRGRDPFGMVVSIGDKPFKVVGTITPQSRFMDTGVGGEGESGGHNAASNFVSIFIPFETAIGRFGPITIHVDQGKEEFYKLELDRVILECEDPLLAVKPLQAILDKGHKEVDYEITVPLEMLRQRQRTREVFNLVLLMVAGLTLLVGGMGIVNIMLVSVAERTKEIGIRRALGAKRRDILLQFLIETLALTVTGGLLGIAAGLGGVYGVAAYTGWPVSVTTSAVLGSFLVSVAAGVVFGLYPARRAAAVLPVVALRYE